MDLTLTEEHKNIKEAAREFAQRVLKPGVIERDTKGEYPVEGVRQMKEMGFIGMTVSEKYGGRRNGHDFICIGYGRNL